MDDKKDKTPEEFVQDIQEACSKLGWHIAMNDSNSTVQGLIIGNAEFLDNVVQDLSNGDEYSIFAKASADNGDLH